MNNSHIEPPDHTEPERNSEREVFHTAEALTPTEGGTYQQDGAMYRFARMPTGKEIYNATTGRLEPGYHSLKTWFSHDTEGIGGGPGWDSRRALEQMAPGEMELRYGHKFTRAEISAPGGQWEVTENGEELIGGMPENIIYYGLERTDRPT